MRLFALLYIILTTGCATQRVWIQKQEQNSGIIAYENYNPKSDNGKKIRNLIPCSDFRITANPIYRLSNGNSGYVYSGGILVPIDGGYTERAEIHYQCESGSTPITIRYSRSYCIDECKKMNEEGSLVAGISEEECVKKLCE